MDPDSKPSFIERLTSLLLREPEDREQLLEILHSAYERNLMDADALTIIEGALAASDTRVTDVMIPRAQMDVIDVDDPLAEIVPIVIEAAHSRFPVIDGDRDNVLGILLAKDLLRIHTEENFDLRDWLRPAVFIPESKRLNVLLREFRVSRNHMAIVVDEYGSTLGLVSLEDIIEEIVGEISDESDNDECFYTRLDAKSYIFEGKTHLGDFERILDIGEDVFADVRGEAETLAGLMLELKRDFPRKGDVFTSHDIRFTVQEMDGHRVDKIRVDLQ